MQSKDALVRNLEDAGCRGEALARFKTLCADERTEDMLRLLLCYRCELLEALHKNQERLDTLDYLIYHLKRKDEQT